MLILGTSTANGLAAWLSATFSGGALEIYDGTPPATGDGAPSGNLLATIALPLVAFTVGNGAVTLAGSWFATVGTAGTAVWWRLRDAANTTHIIGNAATSGASLTLSSVAFTAGSVVQVTSFTLTIPLGG